jgi:hypothetical protein
VNVQRGLFDADEAKEEAISRVERSASRAWLDSAWNALYVAIRLRHEVTTDEVWEVLDGWGVAAPAEPRAMGPVMRRAVREGLLVPTSTFVPSAMARNHRRPVRVYEVHR